jgi:hypothetical protein
MSLTVHEDPAGAAPRYVRWVLLLVAAACAVLLAALWWLDPISVTGRQTRFSVVENGGVRQAKLDLMEQLESPPRVLVLGSSRSMQLDPADVEEAAGVEAFNGGVSGGTSQDMYLYARYAEELWADHPDGYPHLVLGVVNDVLRDSGTSVLDPRLRRYLPRTERERDPIDVADQLLQLKTVESAARGVRHVVRRDGIAALADPTGGDGSVDAGLARVGRQNGNRLDLLDARGMKLPVPGEDEGTLRSRIDEQMAEFVERSYEADTAFTGVDPRGLEMLRRTIRLANANGDVPTLWVTPFHPDALPMLPAQHADRDRRFRAALEQLGQEKELRFELVDFAQLDSFGGDPADFHDGIHMTVDNTARVIRRLHALGQLDPAPLTDAAAPS